MVGRTKSTPSGWEEIGRRVKRERDTHAHTLTHGGLGIRVEKSEEHGKNQNGDDNPKAIFGETGVTRGEKKNHECG